MGGRFTSSGDDSTEDLALMAKGFQETGKTAEKYQKNCSKQ